MPFTSRLYRWHLSSVRWVVVNRRQVFLLSCACFLLLVAIDTFYSGFHNVARRSTRHLSYRQAVRLAEHECLGQLIVWSPGIGVGCTQLGSPLPPGTRLISAPGK